MQDEAGAVVGTDDQIVRLSVAAGGASTVGIYLHADKLGNKVGVTNPSVGICQNLSGSQRNDIAVGVHIVQRSGVELSICGAAEVSIPALKCQTIGVHRGGDANNTLSGEGRTGVISGEGIAGFVGVGMLATFVHIGQIELAFAADSQPDKRGVMSGVPDGNEDSVFNNGIGEHFGGSQTEFVAVFVDHGSRGNYAVLLHGQKDLPAFKVLVVCSGVIDINARSGQILSGFDAGGHGTTAAAGLPTGFVTGNIHEELNAVGVNGNFFVAGGAARSKAGQQQEGREFADADCDRTVHHGGVQVFGGAVVQQVDNTDVIAFVQACGSGDQQIGLFTVATGHLDVVEGVSGATFFQHLFICITAELVFSNRDGSGVTHVCATGGNAGGCVDDTDIVVTRAQISVRELVVKSNIIVIVNSGITISVNYFNVTKPPLTKHGAGQLESIYSGLIVRVIGIGAYVVDFTGVCMFKRKSCVDKLSVVANA